MTTAKERSDGSRRRRKGRALGAGVFAATLVATGGARASCESTRITTEPGELPAVWRAAVLALAQQTQRAGAPWSCSGGALLVRLEDDQRAVLRYHDVEGRLVERHVPSPRALVPTAEALLASASAHEAPRPAVTDEVEQPPQSLAPTAPARLPREPRAILDATVGVRFSGPSPTLWLAPEFRATVPFDAWSGGVWVRYGVPHAFDSLSYELVMEQVNLGVSVGRRLISAPVELRVAFNPSLSVLSMEAELGGPEREGVKIDLYLGLGLSVAVPFTETWRGVFVADAELVPAAIREERRLDPVLPVLPAYELGLAFGVELVAR